MNVAPARAESMLRTALEAWNDREDALVAVLDELPVATYITDLGGVVSYFNRACLALAGRTPVVQHDRWCVTWKLYTLDGAFLPHDACPMALALRERRAIRGAEALAERPDGSRIRFVPYPTPLLNKSGEMVGAVNLLVDVTEQRHVEALRSQAERCRRLAKGIDDARTKDTLTGMAGDYEAQAVAIIGATDGSRIVSPAPA